MLPHLKLPQDHEENWQSLPANPAQNKAISTFKKKKKFPDCQTRNPKATMVGNYIKHDFHIFMHKRMHRTEFQ